MSIKLRELIRQVRASKTAAEERAVIAKECALIRTAIKDEDATYRHRNVAKLIYVSLLGFPTHFGQMECLKLIASAKFSDKRIGYLGMQILIEETSDVLTLVTNTLSIDLNSSNPYIAGLAFGALSNVGSGEMLRDLSTTLHKKLDGSEPYLMKKALMCVGQLLTFDPEAMPDFMPRITALLSDSNHAVQLAAVAALTRAALSQPVSGRKSIRKTVPTLVKLLKKLAASGFAPEYDVSGHNDPHLQVAILKLLRLLGEEHEAASEHMGDILAQVATNTDGGKNAGNAILNEVVRTIMGIQAEPGLRVLAVNVLGRFLSNKDTNIRYVALATLERLVHVDTPAVQRHRATIVACLKDPDVSIRNRALDNMFLLFDASNVEEMAREIVAHLGVASKEQKADLTSRLADVINRFDVSRRWKVDTLLDILVMAGNEAPRHVNRQCVFLVGSSPDPELKAYVCHRLFSALAKKDAELQLGLVRTALWVIGEFGDLLLQDPPAACAEAGFECTARQPVEVLQCLERIERAHDSDAETRAMGLITALKLNERYPSAGREFDELLDKLVGMFQTSMNVELQARCFEFSQLLQLDQGLVHKVLAMMPVLSEAELNRIRERNAGGATIEGGRRTGGNQEPDLLMGDVEKPDTTATTTATTTTSIPSTAPTSSLLDLENLFGGGSAAAASTNNGTSPPPPPPQLHVPISFKKDLNVVLHFNGPATFPGSVSVTAHVGKVGDGEITNIVLQAAVPKYMSVKLHPATGTTVNVNGQGFTQGMDFTNPSQDQPYRLKLKATWTDANGQAVEDTVTVSEFPKPSATTTSTATTMNGNDSTNLLGL